MGLLSENMKQPGNGFIMEFHLYRKLQPCKGTAFLPKQNQQPKNILPEVPGAFGSSFANYFGVIFRRDI